MNPISTFSEEITNYNGNNKKEKERRKSQGEVYTIHCYRLDTRTTMTSRQRQDNAANKN